MSSIAVKYEAASFEAGQNVMGRIVLLVEKKPVQMKSFKIDIAMDIEGTWESYGCFDPSTGVSLKGDTLMVIEVNQQYQPGTHEIPFAYPIPANLPGSSKQQIKTASIIYNYRLKIEGVKASAFSSNPRAVVPLLITDNKSLPIVPAIMSKNQKARVWCCIPKGESSLDASVNSTAFVVGREQTIDITVTFRNNTVFEATTLQAQVIYYMEMRESRWTLIWQDQPESVKGWRIASSVVCPIQLAPGQSVENFVLQCPMPDHGWRCFEHKRTKTYAVLAVTANFKDAEIPSVLVALPISVHE